MEIRSTPLAAMAGAVSGVTPPGGFREGPSRDHVHRAGAAWPRPCCRAARRRRRPPAPRRAGPACPPPPRSSPGGRRRAWRARSPGAMPPATATWLSLISTASSRPKRWLPPPPTARRISPPRAGPAWSCACRRSRRVRPRRRDDAAGGGGDAAEVAEEVERRALAGQQPARRPLQRRDDVARRDRAAVAALDVEPDRGLDQAEGEARQVEPGDDAGLARAHSHPRALAGGHDRVRGEVAGAAEVLQQRRADERLQQHVGQRRDRQASCCAQAAT